MHFSNSFNITVPLCVDILRLTSFIEGRDDENRKPLGCHSTASLTLSALRFHHRQLQPPSRDLVRAVEANVALQMMLAATHVAVTDSFNFNFARCDSQRANTQTILAIAQVASFALNLDEVRKSLAAFWHLGMAQV
jgi:hypothetical protein